MVQSPSLRCTELSPSTNSHVRTQANENEKENMRNKKWKLFSLSRIELIKTQKRLKQLFILVYRGNYLGFSNNLVPMNEEFQLYLLTWSHGLPIFDRNFMRIEHSFRAPNFCHALIISSIEILCTATYSLTRHGNLIAKFSGINVY